MPQRTKPPFRADHVGSLLRPKNLLDTRDKWRQGKISDEILKTEDILKLLKLVRITTDNLRKNVSSSLVLDNLMLKLPTVNSSV